MTPASSCPNACGYAGPLRTVAAAGFKILVCPECAWFKGDGALLLDARLGAEAILALRPAIESVVRENSTDPLTQTRNARFFRRRLASEIDRARHRTHVSVALFVVDIEGVYRGLGASAGDTVMKSLAAQLMASVRYGDDLARVASGAFTLIVPQADVETAAVVAGRIAEKVSAVKYRAGAGEKTTRITVRHDVVSADGRTADEVLAEISALAEGDPAAPPSGGG